MNERLDAACEYWFYGSSLRWYRKASGSLERNYRTRVWHFCLLAWWMSTINEQSRWISKAQLAAQPRDLQRSYGGAGFRWRWLPPEWSNGTVKMASKIESTENISTKCKTALLVSKLLKNAGISCTLFRWQTISFKIATTKPAFLLIGFSYIFLHQNLHIADYNIEAIFCQITQTDLPKQPLPCIEIALSVLKASCAAGAQWQRALCFMEAGTVGQRWTNFPLWGTDMQNFGQPLCNTAFSLCKRAVLLSLW